MDKRLNHNYLKFFSGLSVIIPPLFVLLILSVVFYAGGLYPFGDKAIAWCDMNQQALPLLIDFRDALLNGEGIFHSAKNAGGMNFFGVFFFNLSSPFSFLALLVERQDMLLFMNVLVALKMVTSAFTAALYFKICHKKLSVATGCIFSTMYALCGYGMLFYQTLAWLDVMYLFPILMIGFDRLTKKDKPLCYIITLALILVAHFYLTYMVAVFLILWFGVLVVSGEIKSKKTVLTFCVSSVLSALLSAVVWLPALKQYLTSGRGESILETLATSSLMTSTNTVVPLLLCTSALAIVFFDTVLHFSRATRLLKCRFWIFVLTLIPFFIEPINKMWHTGNYMAFPARYGFITVFTGLILAAELHQFKGTLTDNEESDPNPLHKTLALLAGVVVVAVYGIFSVTYFNENREILDQYVTTLWGNYDSFIGVLTVFVIAVLAFGVIWLFNSRKLISNRIFALLAALFIVAEGIFSVNVYMVSVTDKNTQDGAFRSLYALENTETGTEFYRVGTTSKICNVNDVGAMGYNNLGHYTSLNSADYMSAMKRLGYSSYWMEVGQYGGTELTDALFSVKYQLGKGTEENAVERNGVFYKKELDYWLPLGITVGDLPTDFTSSERADIQQELYERVFGKSNSIIQKYSPLTDGIIYQDGRYLTLTSTERVDYTVYVGGNQTLYFDCFDKISNDVSEEINGTLDVYVNGKRVTANYPSKSHNGLLNLGKYSNETVSVTLVFNKRLDCSSFGVFGLKTDLLESAIAEVNGADMHFSNGKYYGTVTADSPTSLLLMLPYDEGYTVKVNGQKQSYEFVLGDFMSVAIEGDCDIEITYTTPLFNAGLIISVIGAAAIAVYLILKKRGIKDGKLQDLGYIAFNIVFAIVFALIYVFPIAVNIFSF